MFPSVFAVLHSIARVTRHTARRRRIDNVTSTWCMHGKHMHDGRTLLQCELSPGQHVCDEVLGVDTLDGNRFIFVDSFKRRIQVDTVCAGDVLHTGLLPFLT